LHMSDFPQLMRWSGPTAPPPQLLRIDPSTLTLMREHMINVHALAEITGIPSLYRWGRAIWEHRPIHEVEREYFEHIFRKLQQLGAAPPKLEVQQQLRGVVPVDYIAEGRRQPPAQAPQISLDMPEDVKKRLQAVGAPASAEDVAAQVAGRSIVMSVVAAPGLAGLTKEAAKQLAKIVAAGFGVGGTGAAATRTVQGFPEEAPRAFFEVGLASTVAADIANALKALAAGVSAPQLRAASGQVLRQRQGGLPWRDPEGEAFLREVEEAVINLKKGDASKYDQLLRQFEEWQKKVEEFQKLYEARQRGQLSPEDEWRYTKLLKEVSEIRDRYDLLKQYIEAAREMGLEAGARRMELESRTISDLARAALETPPGPPAKDLTQWLQRLDLDLLLKLTKDPNKLAKYARRFGVDEQTLSERAALVLRERQWEKVAELPSEELKKILIDETLLQRRASELGVDTEKLRAFIEDALQRRMGVAPKPEPQPMPERPPIERVAPKDQLKPPETGVSGAEGSVTREGQVLIVRPKEERRAVARLEELPDVQTRLRVLLRRRLAEERPVVRDAAKDVEMVRMSDEQTPRVRPKEGQRVKETEEQTPHVRDEQTPSPRHEEPQKTRTDEGQAVRTADELVASTAERVVLDRETLRLIIPALPAHIFSMPATSVLAFISRAVGAPIALSPHLPRPLPRESFGAWLDRVFAGTGFKWRSLAAQRETFVFA
jgi:hypothetical protein